jgi:hypothetical protein
MNKRYPRKLNISRETVRTLNPKEAKGVVGAESGCGYCDSYEDCSEQCSVDCPTHTRNIWCTTGVVSQFCTAP